MSQDNVHPVQLLLQWLASALTFKREGRLSILNGLVLEKYEAMKEVHQNFHSILFEVESELVEIEKAMQARKDPRGKLGSLVRSIDQMDFKRSLTKVHRTELFYKCVPLTKCPSSPFVGVVAPLNDDEWVMVRRFAESICCYFGDTREYCHDLGNVLNYTRGRLEMWELQKRPVIGDIQWALRDVRAASRRLTAKWAEISFRFADIENSLRFGLDVRLDRRPKHPIGHDNQRPLQAGLFRSEAKREVRRLH